MKQASLRNFIVLMSLFLLLSIPIVNAQQPVFRIGVLDNDRGPISSGAGLAVQEINSAGGVVGADGTLFQLELIIQPTNFGLNLDEAVANLNQANIIAALGPESNSEVLNSLPTLQSLSVPVLTPAINDAIIRSDTSGRLFRTRAAQILQGQALASYIINELGLRRIATVQLDVDSTESVVGFSGAAVSFGVTPQPALFLQGELNDLATSIIQADPEVVATFGSPALASALYNTLRDAGWTGIFAYDHVDDTTFRNSVSLAQLRGILSTTTWPFAAVDEASQRFVGNFVRSFGVVPGPVEAASYDAIYLLAEAIGRPGDLLTNLTQLDNIPSVQGILGPAQLSPGETSNNVAVVQLGAFGSPQVAARYAGGLRLPDDQPVISTPAPLPTATPDGVTITITSERQNVRSGPSTQYDVLGQLQKDEQARVIGASRDNAWVVIDFRGRQGWLAVYLLDIFGDLNSVPIIDSPPTPTPGFTPTPAPPPEADLVIDSAVVMPSTIIPGQLFTVSVVVRNAGNTNAGQFAIAATFPPNSVYSAIVVPGLGVGQTTVANLTATLSNTGFYTVVIVTDLNNEVPEGPGEGNNNFNFSYIVNKPILNQGSRTLNAGDTIDLEGNSAQGDATWNANGQQLDALGTARLGVISSVTMETIHWDLINPGIVNQTSIPRLQMGAGTMIGIITADGNRGVIRVDDLPGNQMVVTFRVYQN